MTKFSAKWITTLLAVLMAVAPLPARQPSATTIRNGAKVFVASMPDGFDTYLKAALVKKNVPVVVVATREEAEFEIKGSAESQKAGAAKKIFMGSWHSDEQASISVSSLASGEVVFAYSANKKNSAHGKQSSAEACAKHLAEHMKSGK
jgi:hypothetical protein